MQLLMYRPQYQRGLGRRPVRVDAAALRWTQRGQVRKAVAAAMRAYGGRGCAERVAQEFGDHPETAAARMRWARGVVGQVSAAPGPEQDVTSGGRDCVFPACADGGW
jgi:hypothetical protein